MLGLFNIGSYVAKIDVEFFSFSIISFFPITIWVELVVTKVIEHFVIKFETDWSANERVIDVGVGSF